MIIIIIIVIGIIVKYFPRATYLTWEIFYKMTQSTVS